MPDLKPLRAARWARVSSKRQSNEDRNGLPAQLEEQTRGIATLGAVDTGIGWSVTESGATVHHTPEYRDMLAQAGDTFDVLVVAYVSRLGRYAIESLRAAEQIGKAGASVYFVDERIHTADEQQWEQFAREVIEAEAYRRRLSRTMKRTYESRWRRTRLPAGVPPHGYNRDWTIDEAEAPAVRRIFQLYDEGNLSLTDIASQVGLAEEHVKVMIRNPAYAGIAQYNGQMLDPGAMEPLVDRAVWDRVVLRRMDRRFTAGGRRPTAPNVLSGRVYCQCGTRPRLDGRNGEGRVRLRHMPPLCETWGAYQRKYTTTITEPLRVALRQVRPTPTLFASLLNRMTEQAVSPNSGTTMDVRAERERLARRFTHGELTAQAFTEAIRILDERPRAPAKLTNQRPPITMSDLQTYYERFTDGTAGEYDWEKLLGEVLERVEYRGPTELAVELTEQAQRHFLPDTLPGSVFVGGEGLEPPTSSV